MEAFNSGTLAGAGSFRCDSCGFAIALHERDSVPTCPECGGGVPPRVAVRRGHPRAQAARYRRAPDWLEEAREALVRSGDYLAFDDDDRVRVVPSAGRLDAHRPQPLRARPLRRSDGVPPARAALPRRRGCARPRRPQPQRGVLGGERMELAELSDGDEISIGRFRLFFLSVAGERVGSAPAGRRQPARHRGVRGVGPPPRPARRSGGPGA